jgi:hypothetical protein
MLNLKIKNKMEKLLKAKATKDGVLIYTPEREKGDGKFWCRRFKDFGSEYEYFYDTEFIRGDWTSFLLDDAGVYEVCRTLNATGDEMRFFVLIDESFDVKYTKDKKEMLKFLSELIGKPLKKQSASNESKPAGKSKFNKYKKNLNLVNYKEPEPDTGSDDDLDIPF